MKKLLKKVYDKIYDLVFYENLKPTTEFEKKYLNELIEEVKFLKPIELSGLSGAELEWATNVNDIINSILNKNPREFLSWDVIRYTMFVVREKYLKIELNSLIKNNDCTHFWKNIISESNVGKPLRYWKHRLSSGNLIHHAYHLFKFNQLTYQNASDINLIFEFGGGYGSMCRVLHNAGFKNKYIIFDLPVFSALQKFYLKCLGLNVLNKNQYLSERSGIVCISELSELNELLNYFEGEELKMFIATWSLSETPMSFRSDFDKHLSKFNLFLFAYAEQFNNVKNIKYFNDIENNLKDIKWHNIDIEHLPGNKYLIGNKI
jgi:hypothetical protein